jgi:hypothetical protein
MNCWDLNWNQKHEMLELNWNEINDLLGTELETGE